MEASNQNPKNKPKSTVTHFSFSLSAFTSDTKSGKKKCAADETLNYYRIRRRIRESGLY